MAKLQGLSMSAYNDIVAVRSSDLKHFTISPAHYKYYKVRPQEESPALSIGSATHTLLLEPDKFDSEFLIYRAHKTRCQAFYKVAAVNPGKILLLETEADFVRKMTDVVRTKKHVMELIESSEVELSFTGKVQDVFCKCRCDGFNESNNRVIDIKTTSKSAADFRNAIWNFGYHYSNAFYKMVMETNGVFVKDFVFIVIEKEQPHEVRLVTIERDWVESARVKVEEMLTKFSTCLKTDIWPGYPTEIEELKLK